MRKKNVLPKYICYYSPSHNTFEIFSDSCFCQKDLNVPWNDFMVDMSLLPQQGTVDMTCREFQDKDLLT